MARLAIIGGSGFDRLDGLSDVRAEALIQTPYGPVSAPVLRGRLGAGSVLFLARHGDAHRLPPHRVNYRANLWALRALGAERVVGLAAVGGIRSDLGPGSFAVPDQLIDYTYGREHSLYDGGAEALDHVDFTQPYCEPLRQALLDACAGAGVAVLDGATYGVTQGPRLETAAEIARLERDGCHLVGMTAMPEAGLARELGLCYANLAFVVNWAAGKGLIDMGEMRTHTAGCVGMLGGVLRILASAG